MTVSTDHNDNKPRLSAEELVQKLRSALKRDGDFPASAKIVSELMQLVTDPKTTANQITEIILHEPSLGTRILHMVNSSFYRRAKPIMTVSQAVVQIGMKPLSELCAGLVLLQRFVPAARRDGVFAGCLRKTIVTSLLSSSITSEVGKETKTKTDEFGYLAGSFAEIGVLLLAFYFPQIYDSAIKRAEAKQQDVSQAIRDITGLTPIQLSVEVLDALNMPKFYKNVLLASDQVNTSKDSAKTTNPLAAFMPPHEQQQVQDVSKSLFAAGKISNAIVSGKNKADIEQALSGIQESAGITLKILNGVVGELPAIFKEHCSSIDLALAPIPEFVASFGQSDNPSADDKGEFKEEQFGQFIDEIENAVENREPTASIITTVMETLAWSLKFDRVMLLLAPGKTKLVGRMLLGNVPGFDPKTLSRPLPHDGSSHAPEVVAFLESKPLFESIALLDAGHTCAYIPIGFGQRAIGIVYADRTSSDKKELSPREKSAVSELAELLDRSVSVNV